jgi:hypothetical protein
LSWKLWKKPDERAKEEYDKAVSLRNQKKYVDAANSFKSAGDLYAEAKSFDESKRAFVLSFLYYAVANQTSENLLKLSEYSGNLNQDVVLKVPTDITAGDLKTEASLLGSEKELLPQFDNKSEPVASEFERLAADMFSLGREEFYLKALIDGAGESPYLKGYKLNGLASMIRAEVVILEDPSKAAEFFSQATSNFQNAEIRQFEEEIQDKTRKISVVTKCWFCGRTIQGENSQFIYLDSFITKYMQNKVEKEIPPVIKGSQVVSCYSCYSSIHNIADLVAKEYYEKARTMIQDVRSELLEMINELYKMVKDLQRYSHTHQG